MVLLSKAECTASGSFRTNFDNFINQCASQSDTSSINNIINPSDITELIENEKSIEDDLLTSLQGIKDLRTQGGVSTGNLRNQITSLQSRIESIKAQIKENEDKAEVQNQIFLQSVSSSPKKTSKLGNLNDLALGIFFTSIFIFIITITIVQITKINGSLTYGLYTFISMIIITLVIYALIKEVA